MRQNRCNKLNGFFSRLMPRRGDSRRDENTLKSLNRPIFHAHVIERELNAITVTLHLLVSSENRFRLSQFSFQTRWEEERSDENIYWML